MNVHAHYPRFPDFTKKIVCTCRRCGKQEWAYVRGQGRPKLCSTCAAPITSAHAARPVVRTAMHAAHDHVALRFDFEGAGRVQFLRRSQPRCALCRRDFPIGSVSLTVDEARIGMTLADITVCDEHEDERYGLACSFAAARAA